MEVNGSDFGIIDSAGGPVVPVPGLAHRSRVDEIAVSLLQLNLIGISCNESSFYKMIFLGVDERIVGVTEKTNK